MSETPTTVASRAPAGEVESWWQYSDAELATALVAQERRLRAEQARGLALWAEARRRGTADGYRDIRSFARTQLHLSATDTSQRNADSEALYGEVDLGGRLRPPRMAATGRAFAAGEVGAEQVRVIQQTLRQAPADLDPDDREKAENILLELATQADPRQVRAAGKELLAAWQAEDQPPPEPDPEPERAFRYRWNKRGELVFSGHFDRETGTTLEALFGPLAKPRPSSVTGPDLRSPEARQGDAMAEIIDTTARADDLTVQGGERAVLTITMNLAELEERLNKAIVGVPGVRSLDELRKVCCDAAVIPAIFRGDGDPLYLGRDARHANRAQRRALAVRDKGCAAPWCDRPPKYCTPHHIVWWRDGGPTDIDNLVLLCQRCHNIIHFTTWDVRINPADGLPEFLPPTWVDPDRTPQRNTAHRVIPIWQQRHRPPPATPPPLPDWWPTGTLEPELQPPVVVT